MTSSRGKSPTRNTNVRFNVSPNVKNPILKRVDSMTAPAAADSDDEVDDGSARRRREAVIVEKRAVDQKKNDDTNDDDEASWLDPKKVPPMTEAQFDKVQLANTVCV